MQQTEFMQIKSILWHWLALFDPTQRVYYFYLLGSLCMAFLAYQLLKIRSRQDANSHPPKSFWSWLLRSSVWKHPSAKQDYLYFFLNAVIYGSIASQLLLSSHFLNHLFMQCYTILFGHLQHAVFSLSWQIALIYTIASLMMIDFGIFLAHYCMHRIPFLWQFHKVHHSAEVLTPITLYRMHPVDLFVTTNIATIFHAIIHSLFLTLMQHQPVTFKIYSLNIFTFLFYCLGYNLRHSHMWVQYPR